MTHVPPTPPTCMLLFMNDPKTIFQEATDYKDELLYPSPFSSALFCFCISSWKDPLKGEPEQGHNSLPNKYFFILLPIDV